MPGADDYMKLCWIAETLKLPQEDKDQIFIRMVFNYVAGILLQVFDAVSKFQSLCATYGIDKAIFDKIQHVLDGLVTDDLDLLQLT